MDHESKFVQGSAPDLNEDSEDDSVERRRRSRSRRGMAVFQSEYANKRMEELQANQLISDGNETAFRVTSQRKLNEAGVLMKKLECLQFTESMRADAEGSTFKFLKELGP